MLGGFPSDSRFYLTISINIRLSEITASHQISHSRAPLSPALRSPVSGLGPSTLFSSRQKQMWLLSVCCLSQSVQGPWRPRVWIVTRASYMREFHHGSSQPCQELSAPLPGNWLPIKTVSSCPEVVIATWASALRIILAQLPALHKEGKRRQAQGVMATCLKLHSTADTQALPSVQQKHRRFHERTALSHGLCTILILDIRLHDIYSKALSSNGP